MADNFAIKDASGTSTTLATKDIGGVHYTRHVIADTSGNTMPAGDNVARPVQVQLGNGTLQLGVFAEDAAHSSGHTGIMSLAVRQDAAAALGGSDGDYQPLITDASGRLWVNVGAVAPGSAAASLGKAEDAAHSSGDVGVFVLAVRNDTHTAALSSDDADYSAIAVDSSGKVGIRGTFAEDAAHTSGDLGIQILSVRQNTAAALGGSDADYQPLITDASGRLWAHIGAIDAGETHLGEVALPRAAITVTPTIDTDIMAAGDAVGGKQTLTSMARTSGGMVVLDSLVVVDKGNQKAALTVLLFDSDPSAATITNNSAFAFSTDISKLVGHIAVAAADYVTVDSMAVASIKNIGLAIKASGSANLFAAVVLTSGTPTYLSTTDLSFKYRFSQS